MTLSFILWLNLGASRRGRRLRWRKHERRLPCDSNRAATALSRPHHIQSGPSPIQTSCVNPVRSEEVEQMRDLDRIASRIRLKTIRSSKVATDDEALQRHSLAITHSRQP